MMSMLWKRRGKEWNCFVIAALVLCGSLKETYIYKASLLEVEGGDGVYISAQGEGEWKLIW